MRARGLVVDAAWNYSRTIIDSIITLVVFTFVARTVPQSELGLMWFVLSLADLFLLFDIGLLGLLPRAYLRERARDGGQPDALVGSAVMASTGLGLVAALATLLVGGVLVHLKSGSLDESLVGLAPMMIVWTALYIAMLFPVESLSRVYEAEARFRLLSSMQLIVGLTRGVLTVTLVQLGFGATGVLLSLCAGTLARAILLANRQSLRHAGIPGISRRWKWPVLRGAWQSGGWALVGNIGHQISFGTDTLLLFLITSPRQVVLYGVARRLPLYAIVAVQKAMAATLPAMAKGHVSDDQDGVADLFIMSLKLTIGIILPVVVIGTAVATPLLSVWVGSMFADADVTLRWLLAATLGVAVAAPCNTALYAVGAISTEAKVAISQAALSLLLTLVLVGRYGAAGAAGATALAHVAVTAIWLLPTTCRRLGLSLVGVTSNVAQGFGVPLACLSLVLLLSFLAAGPTGDGIRLGGAALAGAAYAVAAIQRRALLLPSGVKR